MYPKPQIFRFQIAGCIAGVTDFIIYYFLVHFLYFSVAKGIAFIGAGVLSFVLNRFWVFPYGKRSSYRQMWRYVLINCLALEINIITNQAVLNIWPRSIVVAWVMASMVTGLLTFIGFKWWVFVKE